MFSPPTRFALLDLVSAAVGVSSAPGLSVHVGGPDAVDGVNNLKVVTTVTNTGDETLKLLNHPAGPLSQLPTETFFISHEENGASPSFTGAKVKYVPETAIRLGAEDAFTVLTPGQSISVEHDLSRAYNFTSSGAGPYSIEADNLFHYVDSANNAVPIRADAVAHSASVEGRLAVARPALSKRATFTGCSSSQQSQLNSAAPAAQTYVANALSYLQSHTSSTSRFTTWFGSYTSARHSTVLSHFTNLNGNMYASYHFDCTCTDSSYAYVYSDDFGHVYLCGAFWQAPLTGTDSKGGTLVHESSHFTSNAGTLDNAYGQAAAQALAKSNPTQAIANADSHEYFAENNPVLS